MMKSFAHPFRFSAGSVVVIDDNTDLFAAQIIASAVKTATGELAVTPDFGSEPAEFSKLDTAGVIYSLARYHPGVVINSIRTFYTDAQTEILVEFTR